MNIETAEESKKAEQRRLDVAQYQGKVREAIKEMIEINYGYPTESEVLTKLTEIYIRSISELVSESAKLTGSTNPSQGSLPVTINKEKVGFVAISLKSEQTGLLEKIIAVSDIISKRQKTVTTEDVENLAKKINDSTNTRIKTDEVSCRPFKLFSGYGI